MATSATTLEMKMSETQISWLYLAHNPMCNYFRRIICQGENLVVYVIICSVAGWRERILFLETWVDWSQK